MGFSHRFAYLLVLYINVLFRLWYSAPQGRNLKQNMWCTSPFERVQTTVPRDLNVIVKTAVALRTLATVFFRDPGSGGGGN